MKRREIFNRYGNGKPPLTPSLIPSLVLTDKDTRVDINEVEIVRQIGLKSILQDRRVNDLIYRKAQNTLKLNATKLIYKSGFAFGMLTALVHEATVKTIKKSGRSPLRSITEAQLNILLTAWIIQTIGNKVFTAHNILKFTKSAYFQIEPDIIFLKDSGLIQELNNVEVHRLTGKLVKTPKRGGGVLKYYKLARTGEKLLLEYFALYEKTHEELTEKIWTDHLTQLGPELPPLPTLEDKKRK